MLRNENPAAKPSLFRCASVGFGTKFEYEAGILELSVDVVAITLLCVNHMEFVYTEEF